MTRRRAAVAALGLGLAAQLAAPATRAADTEQGRQIYAMHCASCHGPTGVPVMPGAPDFTRLQTLMQPDPALMLKIKVGKNAMPGYAGLLKDRDIMDVIAYLRTLR
jgi:cytochrome c6